MKYSDIKEVKGLIGANWHEVVESMVLEESDFTADGEGQEEYRFIHEDSLDQIWEESLEDLLRECYDVPAHLENYIDYEKWVRDAKFDGAGHHFSGYDGSEENIAKYYVFRNN